MHQAFPQQVTDVTRFDVASVSLSLSIYYGIDVIHVWLLTCIGLITTSYNNLSVLDLSLPILKSDMMYKTSSFPRNSLFGIKREREVKHLAKHLQKQQFNAHAQNFRINFIQGLVVSIVFMTLLLPVTIVPNFPCIS